MFMVFWLSLSHLGFLVNHFCCFIKLRNQRIVRTVRRISVGFVEWWIVQSRKRAKVKHPGINWLEIFTAWSNWSERIRGGNFSERIRDEREAPPVMSSSNMSERIRDW
jgi:hypothetical protein